MFEAGRWNGDKEDHEDLAHGFHEKMWHAGERVLGEFDPVAAGSYVGQC
ncbi:hypothetical protein ML401_37655 (plasmid) [Bradyrhizobium sp. 62B]|nr:hypothetical protein ML401_37655 [Bradyrhizobium sp. 62B]